MFRCHRAKLQGSKPVCDTCSSFRGKTHDPCLRKAPSLARYRHAVSSGARDVTPPGGQSPQQFLGAGITGTEKPTSGDKKERGRGCSSHATDYSPYGIGQGMEHSPCLFALHDPGDRMGLARGADDHSATSSSGNSGSSQLGDHAASAPLGGFHGCVHLHNMHLPTPSQVWGLWSLCDQ